MKKNLVKFIKTEYALIIVCAVFLYFAIAFITGVFSLYKVKMSKMIVVNAAPVPQVDRQLDRITSFSKRIIEGKKVEKIKIFLDLTSFFQTEIGSGKNPNWVECWHCGKKIPYEKTVCPGCGQIQKHADRDKDGMPDYWEIRYGFDPEDETDSFEDEDGDKYTNLEEYRGGSDPTDPKITPVTTKFVCEVKKIFRKPVDVLFRGYMEVGGDYTLEITWEGKKSRTFFVKVGDEIRGYTINEFRKKVYEKKLEEKGLTIDVDESYILLQKKNGQVIKLIKNKIFIEREIYARLKNKKNSKEKDVHVGSEFETKISGKRMKFTVTEITIDQVFYKDMKGNVNFIFWKN